MNPVIALTLEARNVLALNQRTLGELLGLSRRTIQRWDHGQSTPSDSDIAKIAAAVYPHDPALAARLAQHTGRTLDELGVTRPAPPPPPPPERPQHLTDAVVCAAAEALNVPPPAVRPVLLAAFRRAREVGLRVDDVEKALSAVLEPAQPAAKKGRPRSEQTGA